MFYRAMPLDGQKSQKGRKWQWKIAVNSAKFRIC